MSQVLTRLALLGATASLLAACASTPRYPVTEGEAPGTGPQMPQIPKPSYPVSSNDAADAATFARIRNERAAGAGLAGGSLDQTTDAYAPPRAAPSSGRVQVAYLTQDDSPQTIDPPGSVDAQPLGPTPDNDGVEVSAPIAPPGPPVLRPTRKPASPPPPASSSTPDYEQPAYSPPPPPPSRSAPPPKPQTKTVVSVGGPVITVEGKPEVYTVKDGQGLDAVARALDTTRKQLADDNKLKEPYKLKPGQKLKGPVTKAKAYVVQSGDTLAAVAKRFNVTIKALAAENDLSTKASIKSGQKLRLPDGYKDSGPVKKTITITPPAPRPETTYSPPPPPSYSPPPPPAYSPPPSPPPAYRPPSPPPPPPYRPPVYSPPPPPLPQGGSMLPKSADVSDAEVSRLGRGLFAWPLQGNILQGFGPGPDGKISDGVNLAAPEGTVVRAAASGTVVYAGSDYKVLGITVLIHHDDGSWLTSYSYLSRKSVQTGDRVTQGQAIGVVGAPAGSTQTQVHFVVLYTPVFGRDKAKPRDPMLVMPR